MSVMMEEEIKRWTARRKSALVLEIIQGNSRSRRRAKQLIEEEPSLGYRTVAGLLSMNKNTVQRIFQLKAGRSANGQWASVRGSRCCRR